MPESEQDGINLEIDIELLEQEFSKTINICSALITNTRRQTKNIDDLDVQLEILTEK